MEEPRRLEPVAEVLRELYLRSRNQCAFPGCGLRRPQGPPVDAVVGTVFFGLDLAAMLFVLIGAPASRILGLIVWCLGLAAVILAWNPASRASTRRSGNLINFRVHARRACT